MRQRTASIVTLLLVVALPAIGLAQAVQDHEELRAVHSRLVAELMSPFCHGLTLENCPTSGAAEMRDQIWTWLVQGRSEEWIVDTLVDEWGETILGAPRFRGIGVVAWLAPAAVLLIAGAGLVYWLRRSVDGTAGADDPAFPMVDPDPHADALQRRVDREVGALVD
jgi:cytochrome c-type biogenesis protein CcmH